MVFIGNASTVEAAEWYRPAKMCVGVGLTRRGHRKGPGQIPMIRAKAGVGDIRLMHLTAGQWIWNHCRCPFFVVHWRPGVNPKPAWMDVISPLLTYLSAASKGYKLLENCSLHFIPLCDSSPWHSVWYVIGVKQLLLKCLVKRLNE